MKIGLCPTFEEFPPSYPVVTKGFLVCKYFIEHRDFTCGLDQGFGIRVCNKRYGFCPPTVLHFKVRGLRTEDVISDPVLPVSHSEWVNVLDSRADPLSSESSQGSHLVKMSRCHEGPHWDYPLEDDRRILIAEAPADHVQRCFEVKVAATPDPVFVGKVAIGDEPCLFEAIELLPNLCTRLSAFSSVGACKLDDVS